MRFAFTDEVCFRSVFVFFPTTRWYFFLFWPRKFLCHKICISTMILFFQKETWQRISIGKIDLHGIFSNVDFSSSSTFFMSVGASVLNRSSHGLAPLLPIGNYIGNFLYRICCVTHFHSACSILPVAPTPLVAEREASEVVASVVAENFLYPGAQNPSASPVKEVAPSVCARKSLV